jgi:AraC-like DNA-binding protein
MFRAVDEQRSNGSTQEFAPFAAGLQSDPLAPSALIASPIASGGLARGGLPPRVLRRIREYIDENIEHRISVELLASLANLSVWYFVRAFKQSVGVTPHDYLIRRRVERTMELLSSTDISLSQISLAAGFADQSHFSRRFRQLVGMSPRDYRWSRP